MYCGSLISYLKQIAVHRFSVEWSVYINVPERVVDGSDLKYIPHVSCHQREVHLDKEGKNLISDLTVGLITH